MHRRWRLRCDNAQETDNVHNITKIHAINEATRLYNLKPQLPQNKQFVFSPEIDTLVTRPVKIIQKWISKNKPFITDAIFEIELKEEIEYLYERQQILPNRHQIVLDTSIDDFLKEPIETLKAWRSSHRRTIKLKSEAASLYDMQAFIPPESQDIFAKPLNTLLNQSLSTIHKWIKTNKQNILMYYEEYQQFHNQTQTPSPPHSPPLSQSPIQTNHNTLSHNHSTS